MEEFQTKQKSNFFTGLICLIAGALATCVLYFGISRLGYFSFWVSAIGITISVIKKKQQGHWYIQKFQQ